MTKNDQIMKEITINELNELLDECTSPWEYRDILKEYEDRTLTGTAEDFHNLSVQLARHKLYTEACQVLEKGLSFPQYAKDVDLIADYLIYGIKCECFSKCEVYYQRLLEIPRRRWKWRAYDFSVDYLMIKAEDISNDAELDKAIEEMHQIATQYMESYPDSEGGYVVKASIYNFCNDTKNAQEVLQKAVENINRAPKCSLKLADIAFDKGEYNQARAYLEKAKQFAIGKESSISQSYVYYLDFICLATMLSDASVSLDDLKVKELKSLYEQAVIVLDQNASDSSWLETIEQQYQMLKAKLGLVDE